MISQLLEYLSPFRLLQNFAGYLVFMLIAYHKVLLGKLGIGSVDSANAVIATHDFWHQPVVERLGFALIWGTMGMLSVAFIWLSVNGINEIKNARSLSRDYANVKDDPKMIYKASFRKISAGFSPLIIFPASMSWLLPLSYRLGGDVIDSVDAQNLLKLAISALLGTITISLLGASIKLMRTAFA